MSYGSLCFLSFERVSFLDEAIESAVANAEMPVEVIVHDDGTHWADQATLLDWLQRRRISRLILNPPGHNEGVGAAFNRCAALATGDPIVKLDQDLANFSPGWLATCRRWLHDDNSLGMLGLFRYHTDPVDWRKMNHVKPHPDAAYEYVDDFVGSAMVIPRRVYNYWGPLPEHSAAFAEDVEYKKELQVNGLRLGLPCMDLATNVGFGVGPSTVVIAPGTVREIHTGPVLLP